MSTTSKQNQYEFEDPAELLKSLTRYRRWLSELGDSELDEALIAQKRAAIEKIKLELKPILEEFEQLRAYLERGSLDRIAYRAALNEVNPRKRDLENQIGYLQKDIEIMETKERRRLVYAQPANDFFEQINKCVYTYSVVSILFNGESSTYLIVPDVIRQRFTRKDFSPLARNSDLGVALFHQEVGLVTTSDRRYKALEIKSIEIAPDDVLRYLSGLYADTQAPKTHRVVDRHLGSFVQRWRDGARSDAYAFCTRCDSYYPFGSWCNC